jgi:hypothetical protein
VDLLEGMVRKVSLIVNLKAVLGWMERVERVTDQKIFLDSRV